MPGRRSGKYKHFMKKRIVIVLKTESILTFPSDQEKYSRVILLSGEY